MKREQAGHSLQTRRWSMRPTSGWSTTNACSGRTGLISWRQRRRPCAASSSGAAAQCDAGRERRSCLARCRAVICLDRSGDFGALADALNAFAARAPRNAKAVELRFFGGLSVEDTAEVLHMAPITVMREWKSATACRARTRWCLVAAAAVAAAVLVGAYVFAPRAATLTDRDTIRPRRVHQHDGRSGIRRHAAAGPGGPASAVAVPAPRLRRTHPENAAIDEPAGGCTIDRRRCAGRVRSDGRCGGPAGIDCGARQSVSTSSSCAPPTARPGTSSPTSRHRRRRKKMC